MLMHDIILFCFVLLCCGHPCLKRCFLQTRAGVYIGNFKGELRHGSGKCKWSDGSTYEGDWVDGEMKDCSYIHQETSMRVNSLGIVVMAMTPKLGRMKLQMGMSVYTGDWADGDAFDGYMQMGMSTWEIGKKTMDGKGIMSWATGDVFDGCWSDGLIHGFGVYRSANGDVYTGNWKIDKMDYGRWILDSANGDVFDGYLKLEKDKMDGIGIMTWATGDVFDGCWSNGLIHGSGVYRYANGDVDIGNFRSKLLHVNGKYTCSDGTNCEGDLVDKKVTEKEELMIWALQNPDGSTSLQISNKGQSKASGASPLLIERECMQGVLIVEKIRQYSEVTHNNKKNKKQDAFSAKKLKKRSCIWAFLKTIKASI
ncbi:putative 1-phosphatidylinositol-4-phosphate 5-kinase [Medicago truncatula]|uniref:Putative 1-phosphatidylinositol-4-phosphate 5-kinase n=1 Tax=Medicago truncatula TaxID=3880 RepID=A0A396GU83_MEDTR|nr:putative 1-phosphatidylinositol-4-phosphate 5-kinase [Medicago truncatula]